MEEDDLEKCHELLEILNKSEKRLSENVMRLAEKEEIKEGEEKEEVAKLMKKIWSEIKFDNKKKKLKNKGGKMEEEE